MGHAKAPLGVLGPVLLTLGMGWVSISPAQTRAPGATQPSHVYEARVTRVFDGDTLWVKPIAGGRYRKLRLDGLDAPEICQEGGAASRDALAARVLDRVVTVQERSRDDYGRALVRLSHEGTDVGTRLVLQGHAWSYRWRHSEGVYAEQEAQARAERRGLFSRADAEPPRAFRKRHGPCPLPPRQSP
jgi:endonuclease YncB( thermonuclease family)